MRSPLRNTQSWNAASILLTSSRVGSAYRATSSAFTKSLGDARPATARRHSRLRWSRSNSAFVSTKLLNRSTGPGRCPRSLTVSKISQPWSRPRARTSTRHTLSRSQMMNGGSASPARSPGKSSARSAARSRRLCTEGVACAGGSYGRSSIRASIGPANSGMSSRRPGTAPCDHISGSSRRTSAAWPSSVASRRRWIRRRNSVVTRCCPSTRYVASSSSPS